MRYLRARTAHIRVEEGAKVFCVLNSLAGFFLWLTEVPPELSSQILVRILCESLSSQIPFIYAFDFLKDIFFLV